mmetsp:Transcript_424/g.1260  ORF Transcript_424/g.1260 Transcript_424/m.1260 type:complete len:253 (-) Transcript_424:1052-1810(-)
MGTIRVVRVLLGPRGSPDRWPPLLAALLQSVKFRRASKRLVDPATSGPPGRNCGEASGNQSRRKQLLEQGEAVNELSGSHDHRCLLDVKRLHEIEQSNSPLPVAFSFQRWNKLREHRSYRGQPHLEHLVKQGQCKVWLLAALAAGDDDAVANGVGALRPPPLHVPQPIHSLLPHIVAPEDGEDDIIMEHQCWDAVRPALFLNIQSLLPVAHLVAGREQRNERVLVLFVTRKAQPFPIPPHLVISAGPAEGLE